MTDLISIIIPAFNCENYLSEAIKSIQNQSYPHWEIIIDDGSTDNTPPLIDQIAKSDNRIFSFHQKNGRQGVARNNGISHARGEWIAFIDADDVWPHNKLSIQLKKPLDANVDLSFTDGFICLRNNMELREYRFGVIDKIYQGHQAIIAFHQQNRIPTSSVLVKKSALIEVGGFPEKLDVQNCEDYLLWVKILLLMVNQLFD